MIIMKIISIVPLTLNPPLSIVVKSGGLVVGEGKAVESSTPNTFAASR